MFSHMSMNGKSSSPCQSSVLARKYTKSFFGCSSRSFLIAWVSFWPLLVVPSTPTVFAW